MNLREAAQQALEALLWQAHAKPAHNPSIVNDAITALRTALDEPEQEPVAWAVHYNGPIPLFTKTKSEAEAWGGNHISPLYLHPPQRTEPEQEPVAWRFYDGKMWCYVDHLTDLPETKFQPLYTHPPQRKPLSEEEINAVVGPLGFAQLSPLEVARAIEAAHGIKQEEA